MQVHWCHWGTDRGTCPPPGPCTCAPVCQFLSLVSSNRQSPHIFPFQPQIHSHLSRLGQFSFPVYLCRNLCDFCLCSWTRTHAVAVPHLTQNPGNVTVQVCVVFYLVVDRIRLSEPQSPGTAWFLDQLLSAITVTKLLFDLLADSTIVSNYLSSYLRCLCLKVLPYLSRLKKPGVF